MKGLSVIIPAGVTAFLTAVAVFCAIWLTGLVPEGEWARLLKAGIVIFIIGSTLLIIAWSAYFTYIVRQSLQHLNEEGKEESGLATDGFIPSVASEPGRTSINSVNTTT